MKRHLAVVALAFASACAEKKPAPDSTAAAATGTIVLPAPDTLKAAPVPVPDSTKMRKQADTKGAASKGAPIIGRDSVRQGPIIGIPTIKDTTKKKP